VSLVGDIVFILALILSVPAAFLGLPGSALVVVATFVYGWATGFQAITPALLIGLALTAVVAETADHLVQAAGSKHYGASTKASAASLIGGIFGAIFLWPILGGLLMMVGITVGLAGLLVSAALVPFLGALLGAYAAVYFVERRAGKDKDAAMRAARGAALGRAWGTLLKFGLTIGMITFVFVRIYW